MNTTYKLNGTEIGAISLAPMAGMADRTFRIICKEHGADFITTEMVSAKAVCYGDEKTEILSALTTEEQPAAIQLFGREPETMASAASILLEKFSSGGIAPTSVDINMGCPVNKIVKNGEGSALMKEPLLAGEIIYAVKKACGSTPVTVKMRLGWDKAHINAPEIAKIAEESGASAVTVHARTREQFYAPGADIEKIADVKKAVGIPVIGNGDIFCGKDVLEMFSKTGCDGISIARGALGNPWIFDEIKAVLDGKTFSAPKKKKKSMKRYAPRACR